MITRRALLKSALIGSGSASLFPRTLLAAAASPTHLMQAFIQGLPKAELHLHIEGTLEPDMKFRMAKRNGLRLPYRSVEEMRASYQRIHDLQSFLEVYYEGTAVLKTEQDFYELTLAYLKKAASQNILYVEMFFDPQQHMRNGIAFETVIKGLTRGQKDGQKLWGIDSQLIMCFLRELTADSAMQTLEAALPYKEYLVGVGLDSDEKDNPPNKFSAVFKRAREEGLRVTVHCDLNQKDIHEHIRQAVEQLQVDRIDHGGNVIDSPELIKLVKDNGLYLTVCPGSSGTSIQDGKPVDVVRTMLNAGLNVTLNSDDPAYMSGNYLNETFINAQKRSQLSAVELVSLARNAFEASWISDHQKARYLTKLDTYANQWLPKMA